MTASDNLVLCDVADEVAVITLNRPDRMNAINHDMLRDLTEIMRQVAEDPDIGCVVLTGAGHGFCAGGDLKDGAQPPPAQRSRLSARQTRGATLRYGAEASRLLHEMPKLTIAMINGPVAGAGIGLAGACDLRFAARGATFVSAYDRVGGAGDYGATWTWTRLLGGAKARELFYLGASLTAQEAFAFSLYTKLFDEDELRQQTMSHARRIAGGNRASWAYMKANLNAAETMTFAAHLDLESLHMGLATAAVASARKDVSAAG